MKTVDHITPSFYRCHTPSSDELTPIYSPEHFVRLIAQLKIEPAQLSVITSDDEMVTGGMNIQARYPFNARHERLQQFLSR
jgi:hypothetical protein